MIDTYISKRVPHNRKHDGIANHIIEQFQPVDDTFLIGSESLRLDSIVIKVIFGIITGTREICTNYLDRECPPRENSPFVLCRFPGVTNLKLPVIRSKL